MPCHTREVYTGVAPGPVSYTTTLPYPLARPTFSSVPRDDGFTTVTRGGPVTTVSHAPVSHAPPRVTRFSAHQPIASRVYNTTEFIPSSTSAVPSTTYSVRHPQVSYPVATRVEAPAFRSTIINTRQEPLKRVTEEPVEMAAQPSIEVKPRSGGASSSSSSSSGSATPLRDESKKTKKRRSRRRCHACIRHLDMASPVRGSRLATRVEDVAYDRKGESWVLVTKTREPPMFFTEKNFEQRDAQYNRLH